MKPLEQELKEFTQVGEFSGYRILARGEERILYDIAKREVFLRYTSKDDIYKYIKENQEKTTGDIVIEQLPQESVGGRLKLGLKDTSGFGGGWNETGRSN